MNLTSVSGKRGSCEVWNARFFFNNLESLWKLRTLFVKGNVVNLGIRNSAPWVVKCNVRYRALKMGRGGLIRSPAQDGNDLEEFVKTVVLHY